MKTCNLLMMALISSLLVQCEEPDYHKAKLYLPLSEETEWNYLREYFTATEPPYSADTVSHMIKGDTVLSGLRYVKVVDEYNNLVKVMRKEGSKYYGMNHELYSGFTAEYLFLDDDATIGTSWRHYKHPPSFTEYKVVAINATRNYNGITYHNVMEMEVNYHLDEEDIHYETRHYYAKGIGEIYAFYPYPASFAYSDMSMSLIDYSH